MLDKDGYLPLGPTLATIDLWDRVLVDMARREREGDPKAIEFFRILEKKDAKLPE